MDYVIDHDGLYTARGQHDVYIIDSAISKTAGADVYYDGVAVKMFFGTDRSSATADLARVGGDNHYRITGLSLSATRWYLVVEFEQDSDYTVSVSGIEYAPKTSRYLEALRARLGLSAYSDGDMTTALLQAERLFREFEGLELTQSLTDIQNKRLEYYIPVLARVFLSDPLATVENSVGLAVSGPTRSAAVKAILDEYVAELGPRIV